MASSGTISQALPIITQVAAAVHDLKTGSTAQTLAAHTQSLTASSLEHMAVGVATMSEEIGIVTTHTAESTAYATESVAGIIEQDVSASATASGSYEYDVFSYESASMVASDAYQGDTTALVSSTVLAKDQVAPTFALSVNSIMVASDDTSGLWNVAVEGLATISDEATPSIIYNEAVSSTVVVSDDGWFGLQELAEGVLTASDEVVAVNVVTELVSTTATMEETTEQWKVAFESVDATAVGTDNISFEGSVYNEEVDSTVIMSDWVWAKDFGAVAWVMNTQSGGITNYNNFGFNSIAFHAGKLYATSPEGLFELGADKDDGRDISALAKGGFLDFGAEETKRISDIFVGYTGGDLECDVETYDGPEEVYTYPMERRDADAPRNNRLKVGKGLSSRYWRFGFRNVGGADFQIHDVAVEVARSKRRL